MNKVLIYSWSGSVKLDHYGYQHNVVVEENLHTLIDFFLEKKINIMVSPSPDTNYQYVLFVDKHLFGQR